MKVIKSIVAIAFLMQVFINAFSQINCGPMSNPNAACAGTTVQVSANAVPGALSYVWVGVFNGVSGTSFSSTITSTPNNTLTISSNQHNGYISWDLRAYEFSGGSGNNIGFCSSAINVSSSQPSTPYDISWSGNLCIEQAKTYTCTSVSGAYSYTWEVVETGYTQESRRNSIVLAGYWFNSPGFYTLRVKANNSCGSSGWRSATITIVNGCPQW